jgi:hypothetical protein
VERPEVELPPAKKRKLDAGARKLDGLDTNGPLFPFTLVPSPQEVRSLETSASSSSISDNQLRFG